MPLLVDGADPLGTDQFATRAVPLSEAHPAVRRVPEEVRRHQEGGLQALTPD